MNRRIFPLLIMMCIFISMSYMVTFANDKVITYYVAPNGNDFQNGEETSPLATLEAAKEKVRNSGYLGKNKIEVVFKGGHYLFNDTINFDAKDSGTKEFPVVYKAENEEKVYFDGGVEIQQSDAKKISDKKIIRRLNPTVLSNIRVIDLKKYGINKIPKQVRQDPYIVNLYSPMRFYINDKEQILSRWPNNNEWVKTGNVIDPGEIHEAGRRSFDGKGGSWVYGDERIEKWETYDDVWMYGRFCVDWAPNTTLIKKIDKEKNIIEATYNAAYSYGVDKPYYFFNVLEELDYEGEFYADENTCNLYYYVNNEKPDDFMYVTYLDKPFLKFKFSKYINFESIIFQGTREGAIYANDCRSLRFFDCTMRYIGLQAMQLQGGYDYIVDNCLIYECGTGAIYVDSGDKLYLKPSGTRIINNHIYNYSQWKQTYSPAVGPKGVGEVIANNEIHSGNHLALGSATSTVIEYNDIYDILRTTDDSGMLYSYMDVTQIDSHIRRNFFHSSAKRGVIVNTGNWAIYWDGFTSGNHVYENIFYDLPGGLHLNGGQCQSVYNNLFVNCETGLYSHAFTSHGADDFWNKADKVDYAKGVWKQDFPNIVKYRDNDQYKMFKDNVIKNNISYNVYRNVVGDSMVKEIPNINSNNITIDKNIFKDLSNFDFSMGSAKPFADFNELDMRKVGRNKRTYEEIEEDLPFK